MKKISGFQRPRSYPHSFPHFQGSLFLGLVVVTIPGVVDVTSFVDNIYGIIYIYFMYIYIYIMHITYNKHLDEYASDECYTTL